MSPGGTLLPSGCSYNLPPPKKRKFLIALVMQLHALHPLATPMLTLTLIWCHQQDLYALTNNRQRRRHVFRLYICLLPVR